MSARDVIATGLDRFNAKQRETGKRVLESLELRMLMYILEDSLAAEMGQLRDDLESVASQADVDLNRELDWATDIIVATMRGDDRLEVELEDDKVSKIAALYTLKVEREEGRTIIRLIRNTKS